MIPKTMFFDNNKYRHYRNYKTKAEVKRNARRVRLTSGLYVRVNKASIGSNTVYAVYVR